MPIKPIRTPSDLEEARDNLSTLILSNNDGENDDQIEILSALIERFERTQVQMSAPSPVAAIKFRMAELGLSPRQLEPFIGSRGRVSEVLSAKRSLSIDMIRSLHEGLGIPYASLIEQRSRPRDSEFDVTEPTIARLNSFGFDLEQQDLLPFLQATVPGATAALLKKTRTQRATSKTDQAALILWQAAVRARADADQPVVSFDRSSLDPPKLRRLAMLSTQTGGPQKAVNDLKGSGVRVIVLPQLPGTFLDGAAMLDADGNPIIGLTLRYDRTDSFWFTLLHETSHIHLHYEYLRGSQSVFVDDIDIESDDAQEREADTLARNSLVPDSIIAQVHWSNNSTLDDLTAVSVRARVHISNVVGRWQRDHQNHRRFARLIERNAIRQLFSRN